VSSSVSVSSVVISRYAGALADLAEESKSIPKVEKDLISLSGIIKESQELSSLIHSQSISADKQLAVLSDICDKAKFQKLTFNFLGVLAQNRRLNALEEIIDAFGKVLAKRAGQVSVNVETAEKITAAQEKDIKQKIEKALGTTIAVETKVTPEIIGGMIVTIGSYMVDDSVRRKIERLGVALKSNANQNTIQNLKEVI